MYNGILKRHMFAALDMFEDVLQAIPQARYAEKIGGFIVWHQIYHIAWSADRLLSDPGSFSPPSFHTSGLDDLSVAPQETVPAEELFAYVNEFITRTRARLETLSDYELIQRMPDQPRATRMDRVLSQIRHILYHVGYLHSGLKAITGAVPEWIGPKFEESQETITIFVDKGDNTITLPFDNPPAGDYALTVQDEEVVLQLDKRACLSFAQIFGNLALGSRMAGFHFHLGSTSGAPAGTGLRIELTGD